MSTYIFILFVVFLPLIIFISNWFIHVNMVKNNTLYYGKGNFKVFKKHFDSLDGLWTQKGWDKSLFYYPNNKASSKVSEFHANIIQFQGKGMILNPLDYAKASLYTQKYIKENFKRNKNCVKWE